MLKLSNVGAGYGNSPVLQNIDLTLHKGENLCILGPNGCGKSTLLKAIAGLIPSEGTITINGQSLLGMKRREVAAKIAIMSQVSQIYFPYTIEEAVMLGRYQHLRRSIFGGIPQKRDRQVVDEWLKKTGLYEIRQTHLDQLSGGQLQRVFLAQAMVQEPEIILLDEPTNHLDMKYQLELIGYLKEWSQQKNHMVIGVFHDINLALQLSDRVLFLKDGSIAGLGLADQIITPGFLQEIYEVDIVEYMEQSLSRWRQFQQKVTD